MPPWDTHMWIFVCAGVSLGRALFCDMLCGASQCGLWSSTGNFCPLSVQEEVRRGRYSQAGYSPSLEPAWAVLGTRLWAINKNCPRRAPLALPSCDHMDQGQLEIQQPWLPEFQDYSYTHSASDTLLVPGINIWERKAKRPSNISTWDWS